MLSEASAPATFGVDQKDVYDEKYRKASKMDASDFRAWLDPVKSGLLESVRTALIEEGRQFSDRAITAECYKLNVYGAA